jgi:hypothetical protein
MEYVWNTYGIPLEHPAGNTRSTSSHRAITPLAGSLFKNTPGEGTGPASIPN